MEDYKNGIASMMNNVRRRKEEVIILGNISAKSVQWRSPTNDKHGEHWVEWMSSLNLMTLNTEELPTFVKGDSQSYIDVTQGISRRIDVWKILTAATLTEHRYIFFEVLRSNTPKSKSVERSRIRNDWDAFCVYLDLRRPFVEVYRNNICSVVLKEAYRNSIIRTDGERTENPYW